MMPGKAERGGGRGACDRENFQKAKDCWQHYLQVCRRILLLLLLPLLLPEHHLETVNSTLLRLVVSWTDHLIQQATRPAVTGASTYSTHLLCLPRSS